MAVNESIDRAKFLTMALRFSAGTLGASLLGGTFPRLAVAQSPAKDELFVVLFLRGGCDGLNFVAPISGEDRKIYEQERPNIAMPISGADALLKLDDRFGLHPKATAFHKLFQEKRLAVVHGAGLPANTRSHFDAQDLMELGIVEKRNMGSGWITRFLNEFFGLTGQLPAAAMGPFLPTSLLDFSKSISIANVKNLNFGGKPNLQEEQQAALAAMYGAGNTWLHTAGTEALRSFSTLQKAEMNLAGKEPEYPKTELGNRLQTLSRIVQMNLGLTAATVDMGGWDTHKYQGVGSDGQFAKQVEQLTEAVGCFFQDLNANAPVMAKKTTMLVMTEFGRRLRENANRGTDHGHGGVFFVIGDNVNGGTVFGKWPGLSTEKLYERADLAVTTDYRQVVSEIVQERYGIKSMDKIFPGYQPARMNLVKMRTA